MSSSLSCFFLVELLSRLQKKIPQWLLEILPQREGFWRWLERVTVLLSPSPGIAAWSASGRLGPKDDAHVVRCAVIGELDMHAAGWERHAIEINRRHIMFLGQGTFRAR